MKKLWGTLFTTILTLLCTASCGAEQGQAPYFTLPEASQILEDDAEMNNQDPLLEDDIEANNQDPFPLVDPHTPLEKWYDDDYSQAIQAYMEVIFQQRSAYLDVSSNSIIPRAYRSITKYTFLDMNGDGVPELHLINGFGEYYIFTYDSGNVILWKDVGKGGRLISNHSIAVGHELYSMGIYSYVFFEIDQEGNEFNKFILTLNRADAPGYIEEKVEYCEDISYQINFCDVSYDEFLSAKEIFDELTATGEFICWHVMNEEMNSYLKEHYP